MRSGPRGDENGALSAGEAAAGGPEPPSGSAGGVEAEGTSAAAGGRAAGVSPAVSPSSPAEATAAPDAVEEAAGVHAAEELCAQAEISPVAASRSALGVRVLGLSGSGDASAGRGAGVLAAQSLWQPPPWLAFAISGSRLLPLGPPAGAAAPATLLAVPKGVERAGLPCSGAAGGVPPSLVLSEEPEATVSAREGAPLPSEVPWTGVESPEADSGALGADWSESSGPSLWPEHSALNACASAAAATSETLRGAVASGRSAPASAPEAEADGSASSPSSLAQLSVPSPRMGDSSPTRSGPPADCGRSKSRARGPALLLAPPSLEARSPRAEADELGTRLSEARRRGERGLFSESEGVAMSDADASLRRDVLAARARKGERMGHVQDGQAARTCAGDVLHGWGKCARVIGTETKRESEHA